MENNKNGQTLGGVSEKKAFVSIKASRPEQAQIWRSRLSWNIAIAVFMTILVVQGAILAITLKQFEDEQLTRIKETARTSIAPLIQNMRGDQMSSPITPEQASRLFNTTLVKGFAIYGLDRSLLASFGEPTILKPKNAFTDENWFLSSDRHHYEVIFEASELLSPYIVITHIDASQVSALIVDHVKQTILIFFLLSAFVTSVLMLAMGQWLLEPIFLLRNNILNAVKNPEKPHIQVPAKETRDEIGLTITAVNNLIRQNANNLLKLRSQAEDKIHKLAYYDPLTNLPNRTLFIEKLDDAIKNQVIKKDKRLAVFSVDLDHFKDINDTMGHEIGDKLLEAVGQRLSNSTPEDALIARASADEFIVMTYIGHGLNDSSEIVERIFTALSEPISILQEQFQIRVSVGVSHCPDDGVDASHIIKNADIALNRAKQEGRDTVRYYSEDFDRAVQQRFQLLRDLRTALDEKQLQLFYHPQFDLKTGELIGAEALLRWWKPDNSKEGGHFISPAEFIPIAEQSGLIVPIGEWVLKEACRTNKAWQEAGLKPFRMAVNLSAIQFHRSDIVRTVSNVLKKTELDPKWLELEVTESVFMDDISTTIEILQQLHNLGTELAVDDFGTGYSSLSYLRQFPIDRLKIDQSFTKSALTNPDDMVITKTIISLGHSLGLKVIAEGVEVQEHEDFLKKEGCDEVQGFKYSKPIPKEEMLNFIQVYQDNLQPIAS